MFIQEALRDQTQELLSKFEILNNEIKELHKKTSDITESVDFNSTSIQTNMCEIEKLKKGMTQLANDYEQRLLVQELYSRKNNLLFYGIPDEKDCDAGSGECFEDLQLDGVDKFVFVSVHRLPRTSTDPKNFRADMPKPVMVKIMTTADRQQVLSASYKKGHLLKKSRITIRTDLPVPLKKWRGKLANRAFDIIKKEKYQTRILEKGTDITLQIRKDKQHSWRTIEINDDTL